MNENALMIVLRLFHIFSGVFWAGGVMLLAWFVLPTQSALGQAGAAFMRELMLRRRLRIYILTAMIVTLLSGIAMYVRLAMIAHGAWASSMTGMVLGIGAVAAIIAGGIGGASSAKTVRRMTEIGAAIEAGGGAPTEAQRGQMAEVQADATKKMRIVAALLVITVAAMASARYL
jgi:uncharacterized membrane protein